MLAALRVATSSLTLLRISAAAAGRSARTCCERYSKSMLPKQNTASRLPWVRAHRVLAVLDSCRGTSS